MDKLGDPFFVSESTFSPIRSHNLIVVCSDGNFREGHQELIKHLRLERPDKIALPGGAGVFSLLSPWRDMLIEQAKLLNGKHYNLNIVGLFHEKCAFYEEIIMPGKSEQEIIEQQRLDAPMFKEVMTVTGSSIWSFYERPLRNNIAYYKF
jgi:hypothetical protein